ncbi:hypothetical protein N1031_07085 [Herbiconiux moechotypicola]|uniref:DNA binding protein n=1 Tax=Herbiconiux moechotypicola TaxID=637393 RepID=A0ABP5QB20_9MICO|nr:hypothetical protein [Herbiconiux moechotypicola]MCS5729521.1 hypothetical protein [Herbiconiux moechotypicola]
MNSFQSVLSDVFDRAQERRLSVDDERVAIAKAKLGDDSATIELVYAYAAALRNAVAQYRHAGGADASDSYSSEDLRSAAVTGLIEAIQAFDPEHHERLAAVVSGYVHDSISTNVLGPVAFAVPARSLKRFYGILRAAEGNVFEAAKLAPEFEMRTETFAAILAAVRDVSSYDSLTTSGVDDLAPEPAAYPIWESGTADAEDRVLVEAAFAAVDTLEADVCRLAYGFTDYEPVPDAEIGHRLGLSRQKTQRTRTSALTKMREALAVA